MTVDEPKQHDPRMRRIGVNRRACVSSLMLGLLGVGFGARARAQTFPTRPIVITNGYPPGGSTDISARLLVEGMRPSIADAKFVVENRPGASGTVASEWLQRQPNDGHTLMLSESSSFAIWPSMHVAGTRYRPLEDFTWLALVCTAPMVLIVSPDFPAANLADALEVLRSHRSQELSYSSSGAGSIPHIGAELLRQALGPGSRSSHVPYRGGAPAVLSIAKSETAWGVASLGSAAGLIEGGMVRPLAVTSASRFPLFANVPTFRELGMPEMELNIFYLLHAPAGLPTQAVEVLSKAAAASLAQADIRQKFLAAGMVAWEGANTPELARRVVAAELDRFRLFSDRTGIKIQGG